MANTVIVKDLLQREVTRFLDKNRVMTAWANRKYEGELKNQGDTVTVQEFPNLAGQAGGTAGDDITNQDWAITSEDIAVSKVIQDNRAVKDYEEVKSNVALSSQIAGRFAYAIGQAQERHIGVTAMNGVNSANEILKSAPADLSKTTVHATIEVMRQRLSQQNAFEDAALFVNPETASFLRQASILDSFVEGFEKRVDGWVPGGNGLLGKISKFTVYETNNLPFSQSLGFATVPTADDTITIAVVNEETGSTDTVTLTWKAVPSAAGEVDIGADAATSQTNLINCINGTGTPGATSYIELSTADRNRLTMVEANLSAFASDVAYFTSNREVTLGETFTDGTDAWGTASLALVATDREGINFVDQMTRFKTESATNAFRDQILYESVYQAAVVNRNDLRIATSYIQLPA